MQRDSTSTTVLRRRLRSPRRWAVYFTLAWLAAACDTTDEHDAGIDAHLRDAAVRDAAVRDTGSESDFRLLSAEARAVEVDRVRIRFELSEPAQAHIEWGRTTAYGAETARETSFRYATHEQPIDALEADTTYHYRVHARSEGGEELVSADRVFTTAAHGDTTPPSVVLTAPASGARYAAAGVVALAVDANDAGGLREVRYYDGTTLIGQRDAAPFDAAWSVTAADNGPHSLRAEAEDRAGNVASSAVVDVTVAIVPPVNFSTFGAVGDGVADDTAALQAALDGEAVLIADAGATFLIRDALELDQARDHDIDWNGATLVTDRALGRMLRIDKRGTGAAVTRMRDLLVDGARLAIRGLQVDSRVELRNVDATGFRQPTTVSPAGFYINFHDVAEAHGTWRFDGCDVSDVVGNSNDITTDSLGAANGYLIYWRDVPTTPILLDVRNATVQDCWGEDAQNAALFSPGIDISSTASGTRWTNMQFLDWERRAIKGFAANNTFVDCTFTDPSPDDPGLYSSNKTGLVVVGAGSGATGADNQHFEGCTFVGRGYDGRVIVLDTTNVTFDRCRWTGGADLVFTSFVEALGVGDVEVCAASFGSGSRIFDYGRIAYRGPDVLVFDTDNVIADADAIAIDETHYVERDLVCAP